MKSSGLLKSIIIGILVPTVFFSTLELTQRVRWYFKSGGDAFWLMYGFIAPPGNFNEQIAKIAANRAVKRPARDINDIQIWTKRFPNGMVKHNPDNSRDKISSLGFRSYEFASKKGSNIYRIIATGGSTTGGYESDIDHTYPALLQKKLNDGIKGERRFEVVNAGMGEKDLSYINDLLGKELVYYEPDMVTVYLTFNHLHTRRGCINVPKDIFYAAYKIRMWLCAKSLLFLTLSEKYGMYKVSRGKMACLGDSYIPVQNARTCAKSYLNTPEVFSSYRDELNRFMEICKAHKIIPVLMTEACICEGSSYLLLSKEMRPVFDKMYGIMKDAAKENGALFIDTADAMNSLPDKERLFTDRLHLKPEGNNKLAEIIYQHLKSKLEK